uniref:Minichromosome loss protein Mcl1 middle region domain-containing protein n=1 Tax=Plectus sambesii TaxID=2011161 RepID=A0A914W992_9BILA
MDDVSFDRINVRHLNAWDQASREWFTDLPKDEDAENVCVGAGWFAVYTSAKNVRIFTIAGIQRTIWTVGGSLLTMCAFGNQLTLATTAYANQVDKETTEFAFLATVHNIALERGSGSKIVAPTRLDIAVGPNAQLVWLAYSNQGSLCAMDSNGCVRLLTASGTWAPIFDAQSVVKGASDAVWPISVRERPLQQLRYIYCKGAKHPLVASRPTPVIASWKLPLCDQDGEKGLLEEKLLLAEMQRDNATASDLTSSELNHTLLTTVMRMFALACKSERDCRALEMARLMPTTQGLQMMINYASKSRHSMLSEKVADVARQRAQDEQQAKLRPERRDENTSSLPRPSLIRSKQRSSSPQNEEDEDDNSLSGIDATERPLENPLLGIGSQRATMSPAPIAPSEMHTRNPFKRPSQQDVGRAGSIFDSLDDANFSASRSPQDPLDAKRRKENDGQKKQARLSFNKQANALKSSENAADSASSRPTGFQLWLNEKRSELEVKFGGGDLMKNATQEFRQLNSAEKREWNEKAKAMAAPQTAIDQLSQKSAQLDTSVDSERSSILI